MTRAPSRGFGSDGGGLMGSTTVKLGPVARTFEAVGLPDIVQQPVTGDGWVRFTQTAGGRTGVPAPAPGAPAPVRAMAGPAGVDDAVADHPR